MGKFLNFQDTFETRKWSFISAFLICMSVPLNKIQTTAGILHYDDNKTTS